jgi:hypothetical protein
LFFFAIAASVGGVGREEWEEAVGVSCRGLFLVMLTLDEPHYFGLLILDPIYNQIFYLS